MIKNRIVFRDHEYDISFDRPTQFKILRTKLAGPMSVWEMRDIINQMFLLQREPEPQIARDLTR